MTETVFSALRRPRASTSATLAACIAACLASPALASDPAADEAACSDAARQYFGNFDAATEMRADEPRVDGSRTVGGAINLGNYVAEVRCGFPKGEFRLT